MDKLECNQGQLAFPSEPVVLDSLPLAGGQTLEALLETSYPQTEGDRASIL